MKAITKEKQKATVENTPLQMKRGEAFAKKLKSNLVNDTFEKDEENGFALKRSDDGFDSYLDFCEATSSVNQSLQNLFISQLSGLRRATDVNFMNAAVAFLRASNPTDELETMLLAQMFMTHNLAMDCGARYGTSDNIEFSDRYAGRIVRLNRAFRESLDSLNKHRGKGQQKVTVEHVHVHEGGQAIVGTIEGGGVNGKK